MHGWRMRNFLRVVTTMDRQRAAAHRGLLCQRKGLPVPVESSNSRQPSSLIPRQEATGYESSLR